MAELGLDSQYPARDRLSLQFWHRSESEGSNQPTLMEERGTPMSSGLLDYIAKCSEHECPMLRIGVGYYCRFELAVGNWQKNSRSGEVLARQSSGDGWHEYDWAGR